MSLLWKTAAAFQQRQAAFDDLSVSDESRDRRRGRVEKWLDRQPDHMVSIPKHMGVPVSVDHLESVLPDVSNLHLHHLPYKEVKLDQPVHFAQPWTNRDGVKHHIKDSFDNEGTEGSYYPGHWDDEDEGTDEHEPPKEPVFIHHQKKLYLVDGHHRFLKSRLLGQKSMWGRVYDHDNPEHGDEDNCPKCEDHYANCDMCG